MMRVTIDINERTIGDIGIHRTSTSTDSLGNVRYNVYDLRDDPESLDDADYITHVIHDPDDGAMALIERVVDSVHVTDDAVLDSRNTDGSS